VYLNNGKRYANTLNLDGPDMSASEDSLSIKCKSNLSFEYNPITKGYKVSVVAEKEFSIKFDFEPTVPYFQLNENGKFHFMEGTEQEHEGGYVEAQFLPRGNVTGHLRWNEIDEIKFNAECMFIRAVQCRPQSIARWNLIDFHNSTGSSLMMYEVGFLDLFYM
jgi:hypothetical protein